MTENQSELDQERFLLAKERIAQIPNEELCAEPYRSYFAKNADFVLLMIETWDFAEAGGLQTASLPELEQRNDRLYEDILPARYAESYANPDVCVDQFGQSIGRLLSCLAAELRGMIPAVYEQDLGGLLMRMELFLECYQIVVTACEDGSLQIAASHAEEHAPDAETGSETKGGSPLSDSLRDTLYWYVSDYSARESLRSVGDLVDPDRDFATRIIKEADLSDPRYLYRYGEYVTKSERQMAAYLSSLPEEKIRRMASAYTEGYRQGFIMTGKDIHKKKTVGLRYHIGFERMMRMAAENFADIGLLVTASRAGSDIFRGRTIEKNGFHGANPNPQFDDDHREDLALLIDGALVRRRLSGQRGAYAHYKEKAALFGGPAVVETFGQAPFAPTHKESVCRYSGKGRELSVSYMSKAAALQEEYIKGEERSFTIIAFPMPDVGDDFPAIFDAVLDINTLDVDRYRKIQQTLIDALDQGSAVLVRGMGENRTDLTVRLHKLTNPVNQTNFENCLADVNIPLGEVFTSPLLAGTNGLLHVRRVFLNGLEYKDFFVRLQDGMVVEYGCGNFADAAAGEAYIRENVLFNHESLPLGEFAIGTNTAAYALAARFDLADRLPILIAEKTGPHFALGDTCYSHEEDLETFNPDGKAIIARENEVSAQRKEDPGKAYFNCHTDVTIPYEELGELSVLTPAGAKIPILQEGRFVLPGTEILNEELDKLFG